MYIDSHVHCRDFEEAYKETIAHALQVAKDSGLSAILDMPNTKPAAIDEASAERRLARALSEGSPVFYGLYLGVTPNPEQIKKAVRVHNRWMPHHSERKAGVMGLKMFAGKSVGNLTVADKESQRLVYRTLAQAGYEGVLAVHCEKESLMRPELWDPNDPISHSYARPEESEVESIIDQINFAREADYKGHLHICHVSVPKSVDLIRLNDDVLKISCGVTPHHLLLDNQLMLAKDGILYKVNPPLRDTETREDLFNQFLAGDIDILETDHAPHTLAEKTGELLDAIGNAQYMSGIPSLASWPDFIEILKARGASQELLDNMAFNNVNRIFRTNIPRLNLPVKPGAHLKEYAFDAYASLK